MLATFGFVCGVAAAAERTKALSPQEALAAFQLGEPGLRIELVVAEPLVLPSAGHGVATCAAARRFCATQSASVRALSADAVSVACASARMPAVSAIATIASATRISTSVKPARRVTGRPR